MAPAGPQEARSPEVEIGRVLFSIGRESGGFEHVLSCEVAEVQRAAEALESESASVGDVPEVVPADAIYAHLGGDGFLVDPLLSGRRLFLCLYGTHNGRQRVVQEIVSRAARELLRRAERLAAVKLFSLQVALIECSVQESSASVVLDLLGQQIVDAAGLTRESAESILRPLTPEALNNLLDLSGVHERTGHCVLQLEAGHANDAGALTIVFASSLEGESTAGRRSQEHIASLRRLRGVVAAFAQRGDSCEWDGNPASSLLLLAPTRCPPHAPFAAITRECMRLRDERESGLVREQSPEPRRRAPSFTERFCMLPSPPESERLSWDTGGSATPSAVSSPDLRPPAASDMREQEVSLGTGSSQAQPAVSVDGSRAEGPCCGSTPGLIPTTPQELLRALAAAQVMFDSEAWQRRMHEEGRGPEHQLEELLAVVEKMQRAQGEVMDIAQQTLLSWSNSSRAHEARTPSHVPSPGGIEGSQSSIGGSTSAFGMSSDRLRWSQGLSCASTAAVRVEAPSVRSSSPRLSGRQGANLLRPPPSAACATTSPRWAPKSAPSSERSPPRQPSEKQLRDSSLQEGGQGPVEALIGGSPLTRSRSANLPSCSMLSFVQRAGGPMAVHSDVAVSPQVPPRDVSPARSRSVMQAMTSTSANAAPTPAPQVSGQLRPNMVPYQLGPSTGSSMMQGVPSFPPPVQVPGGAGPGLPLETQVVLPSPRKEHRMHLDDGVRSPLPAPPGQGHPLPKAGDRGPHSARSGLLVGTTGVSAARQQPGVETWGSNQGVRWEQASPCRMRVLTGAAAAAPGRPIMGPPPKTVARAPVAQVHVAAMASKSPTKGIRTQR